MQIPKITFQTYTFAKEYHATNKQSFKKALNHR